jgi:hypothetical protein
MDMYGIGTHQHSDSVHIFPVFSYFVYIMNILLDTRGDPG